MILENKVVIITGVGPGMGQAMARTAAQEGAKVVLAARKQAYIEGVASEIRAAGGEALAVPCDVTDAAQCQRVADAAIQTFGRIDGLVNSAYAPGENGSFEDADVEGWQQAMDVACMGAARMIQAVLPQMKAQGAGAIVNVATMQALKHLPGGSLSYAISKGALVTASRQIAAELAPLNIRVNACRMGWLWGEPVRNALQGMAQASGGDPEQIRAHIAQQIPLRVIPPEEECGKTVLMMLSDYTTMVTGAVLDVNGGEWMAP